jgi:hypothetical protein
MRCAFGPFHPCERARPHAITEPEIGHGDAFVQPFARSQFETGAIFLVETDEAGKVGPEEGAVGKNTAPYDRIATIMMLTDLSVVRTFGATRGVD